MTSPNRNPMLCDVTYSSPTLCDVTFPSLIFYASVTPLFAPFSCVFFPLFYPKKTVFCSFSYPKRPYFVVTFPLLCLDRFFPKEDHIFPKGGPYFSLLEPYFSLFCLTPFWNYAFSFFASEEAVFFPFFAPENPESHTKKIVNL